MRSTSMHRARTLILAVVATAILASIGCGRSTEYNETAAGRPSVVAGTVVVDGTIALKPLLQSAGEKTSATGGAPISVGITGENAAFGSLCHDDIDIASSARAIKTAEYQVCADGGLKVIELQVASDAVAVAVNPANTWASCLKTSQLQKMWDQLSTAKTWSDVDPSFPAQPLALLSPPTFAADFGSFTELVNGTANRARADGALKVVNTDDALVDAVNQDPNALTFFGYTYATANANKLTIVSIDRDFDAQGQPAPQGGHSCQALNESSVRSQAYPLSHRLYLYLTDKSAKKAEVSKFVEYVLSNPDVVTAAGYITPETVTTQQALANLRASQ